MTTPTEIVAYLLSDKCGKVKQATAIHVTVDGKTLPAARYRSHHEYEKNMDAVTRGDKQDGEAYTQEAIYVVGPLPKLKAEGRSVVFTCQTPSGIEPHEWYVACYSNRNSRADAPNFGHTPPPPPFGDFYILMPWTVAGKIDDHERHPYRRVPVVLEAS